MTQCQRCACGSELENPPAAIKSREDFMGNVRVLATDLEFPEGPVVMPDGSVVLVEIRGRRLTRIWPDGRKQVPQWRGTWPRRQDVHL
jgi:glucose/arabinose dehydrogenase